MCPKVLLESALMRWYPPWNTRFKTIQCHRCSRPGIIWSWCNTYLANSGNLFVFVFVFVGCQLCWKDHLHFRSHAVCMDGCIYVCPDKGCSSTKKVNLWKSSVWATYSDETWCVGTLGRSALKYYPCVLLLLITSFAYLFWSANQSKSNIQNPI